MRSDLEAVADRFVLTTQQVGLPGGDVTIETPRSADDLINEVDFAKDERLPYWAELWPSAIALAGAVSEFHGAGKKAIELGCGLGLVTVAALRAGFSVLATDYYDDALLFARRNGIAVTGTEPATRLVNWRAMPPDLGTFDVVLASDVLYEREYATLIADAIVATLAPGGAAYVADPGRIALLSFITACEQRGMTVADHSRRRIANGKAAQTITVHEIRVAGR